MTRIPETAFSRFIRSATEGEKREVYLRVLGGVVRRQAAALEKRTPQ